MAGYSGTPLPQKLGIKPGAVVRLREPPPDFSASLRPLPEGVVLAADAAPPVDVIIAFFTEGDRLDVDFPVLRAALAVNGRLWIAWPKRASRRPTDLDENVVRNCGLDAGLVDVKVCAIDEIWSGLCFMYRKADRPSR